MKKLIALALLVLVAPLFGLVATPAPASAMTGSGTLGDPYMIYNATDLQDMNLVLTAYYELANDIDAAETSTWNGGAGFDPIGNSGVETNKFRGYFDGNGYTISNLWISRSGEQDVGLFGYTLNADISNVGLHNASVSGGDSTGALVGQAGNSDIDTVTITGSNVYGGDDTGGFVGHAASSNYIEYSSYSGNVTTNSDTNIGGFCGWLQSGANIYRCWSNVIVDALATSDRTWNIGGFIGQMSGSTGTPTARECFSYGYVEADHYGPTYIPYNIGGFVGRLYDGAKIYDCGTLAEVYTAEGVRTGGFAGYVEFGDCDIYRAYSAGSVYAAGGVGGFIGQDSAGSSSTITACFWDIETSGWPTSGGGQEIGRNTTDMKTETNYTDFGWDFDTIWGIIKIVNAGYPSLLFTYDSYQLVWFQPIDIIHGTTLPNRAGYEDGNIVWGGNPAGIAIEHGIWVPEDDYEFDIMVPSGQDIINPEPPLMTGDVDLERLRGNPLYPLVQILSIDGFLNERLVWLGLAWLLTIAAMFLVHLGPDTRKNTQKPQHFILTTITGLGLSILFYTMGIFPYWVIILMAFGLVGAIIWERQPVM